MEDKSGRESKKRLWDTGRYLVGCLLLLCMAGKSYAQGDDFGVWTSAEVKKKIFSGFDASLEGEFRTRDGLQTVERWSGSAGVSYKIFRWLKASAGYTFIHYYHPMEVTKKGNYIPEYWQPKHRVNLSLTGKVDWRRFTFSLRERWQYTYRPSQSVPKFDGNDGSVKNDEYISGKGKNVLRSCLQVEYNIRKCAFTPYTSCELSYSLNEIGAFEKLRWTLGTEWKLSKKHALDFYYLYQNKADDNEANGHVIGAGYSFKFSVGAAINIQSSKRVFVVCVDETTNILTDGYSYTATTDGEDMKACLFSEGQLIFSGGGSLTVTGNYKHAITSDDYVRFRSGCNITVASAKKDGIHTNESVIIGGGILNISSDGDAIQCEKGGITMTGGFAKLSTTDNKAHGLKSCLDVVISGGAIQAQVAGSASKGISCDGNLTAFTSQTALYEDNDLSSCAGIKCDGNILITGGEIAIQSTGGAGKGINCDGSITINDGTVKVITTGTQCVYGKLDSSAKGIKADGALTINGGTVLVKATGGEGSEGIESKSVLTVNEGTVAALCCDDCMNASNSIVLNGGNIYCYSSGNDGIDSNGTLTITGGVIVSSGTTSPEDGFDCDQNTFKITGGIVLGIGGGTSTPTSSVCTQRTVIYGGSGSNGELLNIQSADGTSILTCQIPRAYSQMTVLFSSPNLTSGGSYTISKGGTVSGGSEFFGLYSGATYSGGTQAATFTASSMVTQVGSTSGGGQPGGGGGEHGPGGWGW